MTNDAKGKQKYQYSGVFPKYWYSIAFLSSFCVQLALFVTCQICLTFRCKTVKKSIVKFRWW